MELTTTSGAFARELALANRVVSRKPTIPILGNVLVEAADGRVTVTATDLELAIASVFDAPVARDGRRAMPSQRLFDLLRTLPEVEVRFADDGKAVGMSAAGFRARLQTFDAVDFPVVRSDEGVATIDVPAQTLAAMIPLVRFATTEDDKRYHLMGAQCEVRPGLVRMIATDGHRLAVAEAPLAGEPIPPEDALIPKKTLDAILAVTDGVEGPVAYGIGENHLFFRVGGRLVVSRRIDGKFPAWERVVPKSFGASVEVPRAPLVDALRRAALVTDATRKVAFTLGAGGVAISTRSADVGEADERVEVDYAGPEVSFAVNGGYALDYLDVVGTEKVLLSATDERSAIQLSGVGGDVASKCVIMPVNK